MSEVTGLEEASAIGRKKSAREVVGVGSQAESE